MKYIKKCCITVSFLIISLRCFSDHVLTQDYLHFFYVGGAVNSAYALYENKLTFDPNKVNHTSYFNRTDTNNAQRLIPNFYVGFNYFYETYFAAIEFNLNVDVQFTESDKESDEISSLKNPYTIKVKVGKSIQDYLIYAFTGINRYELHKTDTFLTETFRTLDLATLTLKNQYFLPIIGIGVEKQFYPTLSYALEYYYGFNKTTKSLLYHRVFHFLDSVGSSEISVSQNVISLRIIYRSLP